MSSTHRIIAISRDGEHMTAEHDGKTRRHSTSYFRGEHTNFHPRDSSLRRGDVVPVHVVRGLVPDQPFIEPSTNIVAFGSCFAFHVADYLHKRGFNVATREDNTAYVTTMADGMVNTYALLQQFEWAWTGKQPSQALWHGYDRSALGYDEEVRLATKRLFDEAEVFIITFGLSEVWYDEPTGEVFWRAIPIQDYDPARHKFRVTSFQENLDNIRRMYALIRRHRPQAKIVFTLSPVPLQATFRPIPCIVANAESKAILRAALGEFHRETNDPDLYYFPSYEVVLSLFSHAYQNDRTHVHKHVLDFNMAVFERYFCTGKLTDKKVFRRLERALEIDRQVAAEGHDSVVAFKVRETLLMQQIAEKAAASQPAAPEEMAAEPPA